MNDFSLKTFVLGPLYTNAYLVYNRDNHAFVVDAPPGIEELLDFAYQNNISIDFAIMTHGHYDHIAGIDRIDAPCYMFEQELPFLQDVNLNFSEFITGQKFSTTKQVEGISEQTQLFFSDMPLTIAHIPGHTPGSISIQFDSWIFSGDTLFFDSIGRTDTPYGDEQTLCTAISEKILTLPDDHIVYPGHGLHTTVGREKKHNPFL